MLATVKADWSVANAKARFSELIEKARTEGPQQVSRNGKPTAVLVSVEEWERRTKPKQNLIEFFRNSPLYGVDLDLERVRDEPRDLDL